MENKVYVGIDVSKDKVDVALFPDGVTWTVAQDEAGLEELEDGSGKAGQTAFYPDGGRLGELVHAGAAGDAVLRVADLLARAALRRVVEVAVVVAKFSIVAR